MFRVITGIGNTNQYSGLHRQTKKEFFLAPVRIQLVGFEVLTAVSTKMAVFWGVAPCSLIEVYQHFRGTCCLHHQIALKIEAASTSEMLVNFYQTTWRYTPEDSHLRIQLLWQHNGKRGPLSILWSIYHSGISNTKNRSLQVYATITLNKLRIMLASKLSKRIKVCAKN
jgi:hypothetical protein